MTPAELVPSVLRSVPLTDSLARATHIAAAYERSQPGLADLLTALLDDPEAAPLWEGLDRLALATALSVLSERCVDGGGAVALLLDRAGGGHNGVLTAIEVVGALLRGRSPEAALLRAEGLVAAPVAVEPDIEDFDLEGALSEEVLSEAVDGLEAVPVEENEEPQPEPGRASPVADALPEVASQKKEAAEAVDVPEDDFFQAPEPPEPTDEVPAEPTGWFQVPVPEWADTPAPAPSAGRPRPFGSAVRDGQVAHDIPSTMKVAVKVPVEARLVEGAPEGWADDLDGASIQEVLVTKAMTARLVAPDGGFLIEGSSPQLQWVFGAPEPELQTGPARWTWMVTPTARGKHRLQLVLTARTVDDDGTAAETALPEQVVEVEVQANVTRTVLQVGGWAAATFVGGAIAAYGERIMRMIQDYYGM